MKLNQHSLTYTGMQLLISADNSSQLLQDHVSLFIIVGRHWILTVSPEVLCDSRFFLISHVFCFWSPKFQMFVNPNDWHVRSSGNVWQFILLNNFKRLINYKIKTPKNMLQG